MRNEAYLALIVENRGTDEQPVMFFEGHCATRGSQKVVSLRHHRPIGLPGVDDSPKGGPDVLCCCRADGIGTLREYFKKPAADQLIPRLPYGLEIGIGYGHYGKARFIRQSTISRPGMVSNRSLKFASDEDERCDALLLITRFYTSSFSC